MNSASPLSGSQQRARWRDSTLHRPGITRIRCGRGFRYVDPGGRPLTDPAERQRLHDLVVPPAWQDVWTVPRPTATSRRPAPTPQTVASTSTIRRGSRGTGHRLRRGGSGGLHLRRRPSARCEVAGRGGVRA
ncbi:hypothetical protein [Streptomyces avermitilis]|uniref:hypothetical protein n=1 Tax=Streptomyces avermitilis TaxID=33903 RepID=UPI0038082508